MDQGQKVGTNDSNVGKSSSSWSRMKKLKHISCTPFQKLSSGENNVGEIPDEVDSLILSFNHHTDQARLREVISDLSSKFYKDAMDALKPVVTRHLCNVVHTIASTGLLKEQHNSGQGSVFQAVNTTTNSGQKVAERSNFSTGVH